MIKIRYTFGAVGVGSVLTILFSLSRPLCVEAQTGGASTFAFLELHAPARIAALGGSAITTPGTDLGLASQNPALLTREMDRQLSFSRGYLPSGIRFGNVQAAASISKWGMFMFNLQHIQYGEFQYTNENAEVLGTLKAGEYAFNLGWSKQLDSSWTIGAQAKYVYSDLAGNTASGLAADLGVTWHSRRKKVMASFLIRNAGRQLDRYESGIKEDLPLEIQAGISKELAKAPFRFSLIFQHLQQWDLRYKDRELAQTDPLTGNTIEKKTGFLGNAFRHVILNTEILLSKNFHLRLGYNLLRRDELGFTARPGMSGFSFGTGFRVNRFQLSYAHSVLNTAGGSNHIGISTNLRDFTRKK